MIRRIPVFPTLLVLAAVATMVWLGVWQLHRLAWKEGLLAHYAAAENNPTPVPWPGDPDAVEQALFRRSSVDCVSVAGVDALAGRSASGQTGWAQEAHCTLAGGGKADVVIGWAARPETATWSGGKVSGIVAPGARGTARLIADRPQAGLQANARPDQSEIPNNHFAYAVQWFTFAAIALIIYVLALRKRLAGDGVRR
ncbi:SURF1 family protein [Novosphingobium sp. ZN18A2]|uniref:SURF1 family protein n=1 Tax=Novosphingobium sp. ZN18A2 TaxID=3079861 RepID=UPI0030D18DDE